MFDFGAGDCPPSNTSRKQKHKSIPYTILLLLVSFIDSEAIPNSEQPLASTIIDRGWFLDSFFSSNDSLSVLCTESVEWTLLYTSERNHLFRYDPHHDDDYDDDKNLRFAGLDISYAGSTVMSRLWMVKGEFSFGSPHGQPARISTSSTAASC